MKNPHLPEDFNDPKALLEKLNSKPEEYWVRRGEKMALELFHQMAKHVPAYKDFLKSKKFNPSRVKSIEEFEQIPTIDKDNYLRAYPRDMLAWGGEYGKGQWSISTTSGSTGKPFYFPRTKLQDEQYALVAELYLKVNFDIDNQKTLYIVAFPMGAWIGGVFTYEAITTVALRGGYDLSIITPGINKQEVISAILELKDDYDQILIGSYAPFLKDIIDDGKRSGIDWRKLNVGFIFSAEAFSEDFRDYVFGQTKMKKPLFSTLNHYGTVDMGTMAHETPESILVRRETFKDENIVSELFPEPIKQPTLAQYIPDLFYFEQVGNNLLCSSYSGIPLVRYDLKDYGGLLFSKDIESAFAKNGKDLKKLERYKSLAQVKWNLPYVYVYERDDFSVSYYAFNVYPDAIRRALQRKSLDKKVTGKFSMVVGYDKSGRQHLHIYTEMKFAVEETAQLRKQIVEKIHQQLLNDSSEYRETYKLVEDDTVKPIVNLFEYEDPRYFKPGTKQKWILKK